MKRNVAVIFGGQSVEHDISVISFLSVHRFFDGENNIFPIYVDENGQFFHADNMLDAGIYKNFEKLAKHKLEVVFLMGKPYIALRHAGKLKQIERVDFAYLCGHGYGVEDGKLQGLLALCKIPFSSVDATASALCMDKAFFKQILRANGLPTVDFEVLKSASDAEKVKLSFPLVTKPANLGSSIGISICKSIQELKDGVMLALKFDKKVVVENFVENLSEFAVALLWSGDEFVVSDIDALKFNKNIYTFGQKYLDVATKKGAKMTKSLQEKIVKLAKQCYKLFDLNGIVRVDFLFDEANKKLYINEINTIPGSLALHLFKGYNKTEILNLAMFESLKNMGEDMRKTRHFSSTAIEIFQKDREKLPSKTR